jgi:hypothetical protein
VVVCEYNQEQRQRTYTVYKCVPETREVERSCTVLVPEKRVQTVQTQVCKPVVKEVTREYQVCVPEWRDVERQYTVMVPHQEIRQGVRKVCQMVQEEVVQRVTVDRGHWETRVVEVPCGSCCVIRRGCGGCGGCCDPCVSCCQPCTTTVCQRVWVPNLVEEDRTYTVCKPQIIEEPVEYAVTVCKPETRTCTVKVCEMRQETRTETCQVTAYETALVEQEVEYTVCVPAEKKWTEQVTVYRQVPEERTETYTVCVPQQVQKEMEVKVCRMVPKVVKVPVCSCGGCCW